MIRLRKHGQIVLFEEPAPDIDESDNDRGLRAFLERGDFYEEEFLEYIRSLKKSGAYVDAGGFIGTHAIYFAIFCDSSHVYTFEPRPQPRAELERNIHHNSLESKVSVVAQGLAAVRKDVTVEIDERAVSFPCVPLDEIVNEPVAVIKIDVEGMEIDVLGGATRILEESRPLIFAAAPTKEHREAMAAYLEPFGYVRTGRVHNASLTYEFIHLSEPEVSDQLRRAYAEICRIQDELGEEIIDLGSSLREAQLKYRAQAKAKSAVELKLQQKDAELQRVESEKDSLEREGREQKEHLWDHWKQKEDLWKQKEEFWKQKAALKKTLSFQLGDTLIGAVKSKKGALSLPTSLWKLRREASRRRKKTPSVTQGDSRENALVTQYRAPSEPSCAPSPCFVPPEFLTNATEDQVVNLTQLKVACIMDEFTASSFAPECQLHHLSVDNWENELNEFQPDLLLVESAWRGRDDAWTRKIASASDELRGILAWCRSKCVPTSFWNKEDPVHFSTFRRTTPLFDFVFTTDIDCIHRHKESLGHDRVYLLPFACQPQMQNPREKYERKDALCFAGAYYARYPERQRDFLGILQELNNHWPIEIFDRNHGKDDPNFMFPEEYRPMILGSLAFDEIERAYKGYHYAINLNSIKYSQSMFARRVFEVLASNTVTVSNYSRGIRLMLGDLVLTSDDPQRHVERIREISESAGTRRKFKLSGLRKVLREHTYQDRLAYIVSKVFDIEVPSLLPKVLVLGAARDRAEADLLIDAFGRQRYEHKHMLLFAPKQVCEDLPEVSTLRTLRLEEVGDSPLSEFTSDASHIATFVPADYYGPDYIVDLALSTRFWGGAVGKVSQYAWRDPSAVLLDDGQQYKSVPTLLARAALVRPGDMSAMTVNAFAETADTIEISSGGALATDEFNYCVDGAKQDAAAVAEVESDLPNLREGISLSQLLEEAEGIRANTREPEGELRALNAEGLAVVFPERDDPSLSIRHESGGIVIDSTLESGQHQYIYSKQNFGLSELGFTDVAKFFMAASSGLALEVVLIYLDHNRERTEHVIKSVQTYHEVAVPLNAIGLRVGLRVVGPGSATVRALVLGKPSSDEPSRIFGRSEVLVLTNIYPSVDDLYRNAFVHRRVIEYARRGTPVDVFRLRAGTPLGYYEFDDVDVISAGTEALKNVLDTKRHRSVLVHFLDEAMWSVLAPRLDDLQVLVWVHGSEVQPWHRRTYNYSTPEELETAKAASEIRQQFWRSVLRDPHKNLKLVFVSQYFAEEVQEDLGIQLPRSSYEIIHNLIDTQLFSYEPKRAEQRKRILTIRPFASRKYANDLSVQAILELSKKPYFDELEFRIIGDGQLFEETVAPVRAFANVIVEKRFLSQTEIAALHKEYGVFLTPTRMDAQGVSRDEAMASGLVPVTSAVAAVPEFVDEQCGFMAPLDDASGLAAAIDKLYADPALFEQMSAAAAARVRGQSGPDLTAGRELELFRRRDASNG